MTTVRNPMIEPTVSSCGSRVLRVLIVEDNVDCAESSASLMRLYGHEVAIARDGAEAVDIASDFDPDVVLLDLGLPGFSGYAVARHLVAGKVGGRPLLIAVTGYGRESDRARSIEAGIDLHMVKPVDPETLERVLERYRRDIGVEVGPSVDLS